MAYLNKSTLTYPATNAFPNGIWEDTRDPLSSDYRNFSIGVIWINFTANRAWIMVDKTATSGSWIRMATSGTGILSITGNDDIAVEADPDNNINLVGSGTLSVSGDAGINTLTISQDGTVATSYTEDLGSATPSGGVLQIVGGTGVNTSGTGNTVTINAMSSVPLLFTEDSGTATPSSNNIIFAGGTGIATSGSGHTVTIATTGAVATEYTTDDSNHAIPSGNNLNIFGTSSQGIETSSSGHTVTLTVLNATSSQKGVASFNSSEFTVTSGAVTSNAITLSNGNNITITGSPVNLGGTATVNVSGTTQHSLLIGNSTNSINNLGVATNGQLPIGSTGADPVLSTLTAGTGISITNGAGSITITNTSSESITFDEDTGSATPNGSGVININGGSGISTSGSGNTITIMNNIPYTPNGTFTPTISFGGSSVGVTYSSQNGYYTQLGNIVFYQLSFILTSKGSSTGTAEINGLPITIAGPNTLTGNPQLGSITFSGNYVNIVSESGTKKLLLEQTTSGAGYTVLTDANFANTSSISVAGFYYTS